MDGGANTGASTGVDSGMGSGMSPGTSTQTAGRRGWLAAGVGAVVGAGVAVAMLLALGWSSGEGTGSSAGDGISVTLPDTAGGLRPQVEVLKELGREEPGGRLVGLAETAELLSVSRGGAVASVRGYADDSWEEQYTVWAVADESPALWSPQGSEAFAEVAGLATPMEWVERDGDVECLVYPAMPVLRDQGGEVELRIRHCQLVQDGVTLLLTGTGDGTVSRPAAVLRDVAAHLGQD